MIRNYRSDVDIHVWIENKYKNNVISFLPDLISAYLLEHPEDVNKFLNANVRISDLLDYLAKKYIEDNDIKIIEEVLDYVNSRI